MRKEQLRVLRHAGVRGQNHQHAVNLVELLTQLFHVTGKNASLVEHLTTHHEHLLAGTVADLVRCCSVLVLGTYGRGDNRDLL